MPDAGPIACLPQESFDGRGVAPEPRTQYLERTGAAFGVLRPIDLRRAALAYTLEELVAGDGPADIILAGHGDARN